MNMRTEKHTLRSSLNFWRSWTSVSSSGITNIVLQPAHEYIDHDEVQIIWKRTNKCALSFSSSDHQQMQIIIYQEFFCCSVYLHIYDPQHTESASITRFTKSLCKHRNLEFIKWYLLCIYFHKRKINTCELDPISSRGYRWLTLPPYNGITMYYDKIPKYKF